MLGKQDLLDFCLHEYRVIRRLLTKLPEGCEDYRISPTQRSTLELVQYLAMAGPGVLHAANDGDFSWFQENGPAMATVPMEEADAYMDGAMKELQHLFGQWSEEEFATRVLTIEGVPDWTVQTWVLHTACAFLPAYKLQLFHHAKACGATELDTWDAWIDDGSAPRPPA